MAPEIYFPGFSVACIAAVLLKPVQQIPVIIISSLSRRNLKMNHKHKTVVLAKMGMLVAISIVLVAIIHFPIFPAVAFMEYDPADIPILIGTFAFRQYDGNYPDCSYICDTGSNCQRRKRCIRDHNAYNSNRSTGHCRQARYTSSTRQEKVR